MVFRFGRVEQGAEHPWSDSKTARAGWHGDRGGSAPADEAIPAVNPRQRPRAVQPCQQARPVYGRDGAGLQQAAHSHACLPLPPGGVPGTQVSAPGGRIHARAAAGARTRA